MAFKNITPELERELSGALGPEFNAQQQNQLMAFADALLAKQATQPKAKQEETNAKAEEPKAKAEESQPKPQARESAVKTAKPTASKKAK